MNVVDRRQNRFEFVTLASARARQLLDGCAPKIATGVRPVRTAQHEVSAGAVQRVDKAAATDQAPPND